MSDPNNESEQKILTGHAGSILSIAFSFDNQWLASGSYDETVRLWNLNDPTKIQILSGHTDYVRSVAFSHDNKWLASGSDDKTVRLWSCQQQLKIDPFC